MYGHFSLSLQYEKGTVKTVGFYWGLPGFVVVQDTVAYRRSEY